MERVKWKGGTILAPVPPTMVTSSFEGKDNVFTVAWTGILSSDPPRTYISVRPSRYSHAILTEKREFVINLTTEKLAYATDYVGIYTGAKVDKFEKCHLTKAESAVVAAPTVAESPIALECRVFDVIHSGTHDIFMADIVNVSCDEDILDERGRICFERAGLIAYSHGEYYALGRAVGKFGFSAAKKKKPHAKGRSNSKNASRSKREK